MYPIIRQISRQPVAIALSLFGHHFDEHLLRNLITARQRTLGDRPFESLNDVKKYGIETTGSLIQLVMHLLSGSHKANEVLLSEETVQAVESMSHAVSVITLVRYIFSVEISASSSLNFSFQTLIFEASE